MDVGFVGVGRDQVFLQILNKHFGCLGEQTYKKYICLHFYSFRRKTQRCHDLEGLEVKAGHNLRSEAFFPHTDESCLVCRIYLLRCLP